LSVPLFLGLVLATATSVLTPRIAHPVPPAVARFTADVAWETAESVLIATDRGVQRYSFRTRNAEPLVSTMALPEGLPKPEAVASDGASLMTTSHLTVGGYAMRLVDRKRLAAMRVALLPLDVTVRGSRACILALRMTEETEEAVWCGPIGKSWLKYTLVHRLTSGTKAYQHSFSFSRAGAVVLAEDGSLYVVTSSEPGVFHYSADGKLIERLGERSNELVVSWTHEVRRRFASDVEGRYRLLLNQQPLVEDLVLTPRGPALVVRVADKEKVRWELWWPRADGRKVPPMRLGIDRIGPFGHLQCDARGTMLACTGSLPDQKKAADFRVSEFVPHLWIFELPK